VPSGRPRLRLVKTEPRTDPPQRDDVARKTAPRTHGVWGTQWKVEKELRDSPGLAFVRRYLSLYDFSQLERITVRRSPRSAYSDVNPPTGLVRIYGNIPASGQYPRRVPQAEKPSSSGERQPYYLDDESEAVVATIASQVGLYLGHTRQIVGVESIDFMRAAVEAYRRSIGASTSGVDRLPGDLAPPGRSGWCVWCGKPLPKGGGSQSFCAGGRCRTNWHNSQRRARLAARRGKMGCEVCGKMFTPKQRGAKTCSGACRQKKYRELRKDRSNPGHDDHQDRRPDRGDHGGHDHDDRNGCGT
jgi:predicted nucleic acid-binding Zn ribbon protein